MLFCLFIQNSAISDSFAYQECTSSMSTEQWPVIWLPVICLVIHDQHGACSLCYMFLASNCCNYTQTEVLQIQFIDL